jgi:multiple sugar transport system permease protein
VAVVPRPPAGAASGTGGLPGTPAGLPPPRSARVRRRLIGHLTGWGFVGPATLVVLGLSIFPALWALLISRQRWNGIAPPTPMGWQNYQLMASTRTDGRGQAHRAVHRAVRAVLAVPGLLIAIASGTSRSG